MPSDRLEGKVAIVTGGGSGFGAGIVKKFVHEGCRVMIWDICSEPAMTLSSNLPPNSTSVFIGDVSNPDHWVSGLKKCLQSFGQLDILVNNAGVVHVSAPSEDVAEEEVDRMWRVNFKPLYYSAKVMVPYFREKGGGVVSNLSSISAPRPRPRLVWYAASKGAVTAVSDVLLCKGGERLKV
jgi:3-oxoacyl-[acyl-carrier protein] reductase